MTAILMITLCLASAPTDCQVHELQVEASVCFAASINVAQAWVAEHYPNSTIRRIRCAVGRGL